MDKKLAEDIYWVMADKNSFNESFCDKDDYWRIKMERVKISTRYNELKKTHSFLDAHRMATLEWLMNYENGNKKIQGIE